MSHIRRDYHAEFFSWVTLIFQVLLILSFFAAGFYIFSMPQVQAFLSGEQDDNSADGNPSR